jgi:hypothetical protein
MPSVTAGIPEDDLIIIFEIARVALDVYFDRISLEMDLEPSFLQGVHQLLNTKLDPIYGSHEAGEDRRVM